MRCSSLLHYSHKTINNSPPSPVTTLIHTRATSSSLCSPSCTTHIWLGYICVGGWVGKGMYSERKALCSLSQNKRAFTCIPRARTHPHSGIALSHSLSPESRRGGGCVCVWFNFAKRILRTDVYWRQVLLTYLLLLLQFSQLTNAFVRFRNCYRFGTWGRGRPAALPLLLLLNCAP